MDGFEVSADAVKARLKEGGRLFFINVRHREDWDVALMKARGALRVDDEDVGQFLDEIPRGTIIVYSTCPGDAPSVRTARLLQNKGRTDVHPLRGGFSAYLRAGLPVEEIDHRDNRKKIMFL